MGTDRGPKFDLLSQADTTCVVSGPSICDPHVSTDWIGGTKRCLSHIGELANVGCTGAPSLFPFHRTR